MVASGETLVKNIPDIGKKILNMTHHITIYGEIYTFFKFRKPSLKKVRRYSYKINAVNICTHYRNIVVFLLLNAWFSLYLRE